MLSTKTIRVFSSDGVAVALVVFPIITFPVTYSVVAVVWTAAAAAVAVSRVLLKVGLLPGGCTVSVRVFLHTGKFLVLAIRLLLAEACTARFSRFRTSLSKD